MCSQGRMRTLKVYQFLIKEEIYDRCLISYATKRLEGGWSSDGSCPSFLYSSQQPPHDEVTLSSRGWQSSYWQVLTTQRWESSPSVRLLLHILCGWSAVRFLFFIGTPLPGNIVVYQGSSMLWLSFNRQNALQSSYHMIICAAVKDPSTLMDSPGVEGLQDRKRVTADSSRLFTIWVLCLP